MGPMTSRLLKVPWWIEDYACNTLAFKLTQILCVPQIHIRETETYQFSIAHAREQQQFEHDHMRQVACLPDGLVQRHQFSIGQQLGQPFGLSVWLHSQQRA